MGLTKARAINLCLAPANPPSQALAEARDGVAPPSPWHCAPHPAECLEPGCGEVLIHGGGLCRAVMDGESRLGSSPQPQGFVCGY